jgi:hypothetical protein
MATFIYEATLYYGDLLAVLAIKAGLADLDGVWLDLTKLHRVLRD